VPVEPTTKILLYVGVTILFLYLGLYTAVFSIITKYLGLTFAPLVWAVLEFIRTKSEIGFPWGFLGYTQTSYTSVVQIASIVGVYGLSAWVIWINLLIFWIFQKKHKLTYLLILLLSFILPIGYGLIRVNTSSLQTPLKVALVQPNVGPNEKGDLKSRVRLTDELIGLINKATEQKPDLVILPETATLVDITRSEELGTKLQAIADSNNVYLFTGTPLYAPGGSIYYNGAVLFEPHLRIIDSMVFSDTSKYKAKPVFNKIYRKIHLVPFSERIPYADKVSLFRKIETGDMGDCTPGKEYTIFKIQRETGKIQNFGCLICFESILPDLTRGFTKRGADMLVNITNDGWFGKTPGPYQHSELAIMRSVENGVPLVRCANNGISLIADPYARVKNRTKLFTQTVVIDLVSAPLSSTFYRLFGDVFIYIAIAIIIIGVVLKPIRKIKLGGLINM
jgi:apolipoprotein N-acyltransferase